jgi:hypothetical protein
MVRTESPVQNIVEIGRAMQAIQPTTARPAFLQLIRNAFLWLRHVFTNGGCADQKTQTLASIGCRIAGVKLLSRKLARA